MTDRFYARVVEVSSDIDFPFWIKAEWPEIGGVHPDLIRPKPSQVLLAPKPNQFVEIEKIDGLGEEEDQFWWSGRDIRQADFPQDLKSAYPQCAALLGSDLLSWIILDDKNRKAFLEASEILFGTAGSATKGVARLNDPTLSDATTDAAFWAWVTAVDAFLRAMALVPPGPVAGPALSVPGAAYTAAVSAPPSKQDGKISGASATVKAKD